VTVSRVYYKPPRPLSLAIPPWLGALSGDSYSWGRNSEFCVTEGRVKVKFHYAICFEAGSKLVADRFEAATSFEPASVMEFGFYQKYCITLLPHAVNCVRFCFLALYATFCFCCFLFFFCF